MFQEPSNTDSEKLNNQIPRELLVKDYMTDPRGNPTFFGVYDKQFFNEQELQVISEEKTLGGDNPNTPYEPVILPYIQKIDGRTYEYIEVNFDSDGTPQIVRFGEDVERYGSYRDMMERITKEKEEIEKNSESDILTGLKNRRGWDQGLRKIANEIVRSDKEEQLVIIMMDLNDLKIVNDLEGHNKGDEYLRLMGKLIKETFGRSFDLTARLGGDEFACIIQREKKGDDISEEIKELMEKRKKQYKGIEFSGGIVSLDTEKMFEEMNQLSSEIHKMPEFILGRILGCVNIADHLMYEAKRNSKVNTKTKRKKTNINTDSKSRL